MSDKRKALIIADINRYEADPVYHGIPIGTLVEIVDEWSGGYDVRYKGMLDDNDLKAVYTEDVTEDELTIYAAELKLKEQNGEL